MLARATARQLVSDAIQVRVEGFRLGEFLEGPAVDGGYACTRSVSQCLELGRVLSFAALDQPQTIANDFAGILVPARIDQRLNQVRLLAVADELIRVL